MMPPRFNVSLKKLLTSIIVADLTNFDRFLKPSNQNGFRLPSLKSKMGPKKKGKESKKKDTESSDGSSALSPEDTNKMLLSANHALQMQLADRQEATMKAMTDKRDLQSRVRDLQGDFENERVGTMEITRDMTRQYKGMQEELLNRVNALENAITELKDDMEGQRQKLEDTKKEKNEIIDVKDQQIDALKIKMDEMAQEFSNMLKETLDKMRERIEVSNTSYDKEASTPMIRRLIDMKLEE